MHSRKTEAKVWTAGGRTRFLFRSGLHKKKRKGRRDGQGGAVGTSREPERYPKLRPYIIAPVWFSIKHPILFRPNNRHSSMSELIQKAHTLGTDSPQTYPAPELDPYSAWVMADQSHSSKCVDLPCTSKQRHDTDVCDFAQASSSNSRPDSPMSPSPTHVAPTLESLAEALTLDQMARQGGSYPPTPPHPSLPYQKHPRKKTSLLNRLKRYSPSVTLENRGSVARDHLASERTFLAYTRTSLALASTGVALVQLFSIADLNFGQNKVPLSVTTRTVHRFAKPLGITAIMLALVILAIGEFFVLCTDQRWGLLIFHLYS